MDARTAIIEAALAALREGQSLSFDKVAARIDLTKAGLLHYFPSKRALMTAMVEHVISRWEREITSRIAASGYAPEATEASESGAPQNEPLTPANVPAVTRIRAYFDFTIESDFDAADIAMLAEPTLRETLLELWHERMDPWIHLDTGPDTGPDAGPDIRPDIGRDAGPQTQIDPATRAALNAVRLLADGIWMSDATGMSALTGTQRTDIGHFAHNILKGLS